MATARTSQAVPAATPYRRGDKPAPATATPAVDTGALAALGNVMRAAFPSIDAARTSLATDVVDAAGKGQVGRAVGAGLRGVVTLPAAAAMDLVARPVLAADRASSDVASGIVSGILGRTPKAASETDAINVSKAVPAVTPKALNPVAASLLQGREAATATPQDQLSDAIATVLGRNPSISDLQAVGNLIPATTKMAQTAKDATFGTTAQLSDAIYKQQVDEAAKTFNVGTPEYKKAFDSATAAYFQRNAGLVGFDPTKLAQAQLLAPADEDQ